MWAVMPNRKIRYKPFVSQLLQVYKTGLNYQSILSRLPVVFAQVFQREVAKATVNCVVKKKPISAARAGAGPTPSLLCYCHIQHLANRSQVLSCCFCLYPWSSQDSSTLFWIADHQRLILTTVAFHRSLVREAPSVYCLQVENHYQVCFYLYPY